VTFLARRRDGVAAFMEVALCGVVLSSPVVVQDDVLVRGRFGAPRQEVQCLVLIFRCFPLFIFSPR
jgi:hypothetical protein